MSNNKIKWEIDTKLLLQHAEEELWHDQKAMFVKLISYVSNNKKCGIK